MQIANCMLVTRSGHEEELKPFSNGTGMVAPTFTLSHFGRAISTRASASNTDRRQRTVQVTVRTRPNPGGFFVINDSLG